MQHYRGNEQALQQKVSFSLKEHFKRKKYCQYYLKTYSNLSVIPLVILK